MERIIRLHCPKRKNTAGRTQRYDGYLHQKPNIDLPFPNPHKRYKQAAKRLFKQGNKKQAWLYYRTYLLTKFPGRQKQPYLAEKPIY